MPRRAKVVVREISPDPRYGSVAVARLINKIMMQGKKSLAERIVYRALQRVEAQAKRNPSEVLEQALKNTTPALEVRPRRVGGATYQVPVEVRLERRNDLGERWIIRAARARKGKPIAEKLASEILEAAQGQGAAVKKKEDLHRMAEANRAFVHFRW